MFSAKKGELHGLRVLKQSVFHLNIRDNNCVTLALFKDGKEICKVEAGKLSWKNAEKNIQIKEQALKKLKIMSM